MPCVIALFNLLLVNASANAAERGTLSNWSDEDAAAALDMDEVDVAAIIAAMEGKVLNAGRLTGWERRQPKREDGTAAERKAAWKERKNALERTGTHGNAPETDTDTDTETESKKEISNEILSQTVPVLDAKPKKKPKKLKNLDVYSDDFEAFWRAYPKRDGSNPKFPASQAFARAIARGSTVAAIMAGASRLTAEHAGKPPQFIPCTTTWLNQRRFDDVTESQCQTGPPEEPVPKFDNREDFKKWWRERQQSEAIQ